MKFFNDVSEAVRHSIALMLALVILGLAFIIKLIVSKDVREHLKEKNL